MTSGGTLINTGQTGHSTTLLLHLIHGTGTDLTHGQDGIDGIAGGVTAVAGTANTWNNHWYQYGYSGWYGHNSLMWGNVWRNDNTYVHINGRRGSRLFADGNSNIQNNINNRRNNNNNNSNSRVRRYFNPDRNGVIIRNGNDVRVIKPRVYDNPNDVPNNVIRPRNNNNNNIRVNPPVNNNSRGINNNRNYYTPPNRNSNNNIRSSSPPVINRGSSNISRGSSSSSSSSRGSRGNNN